MGPQSGWSGQFQYQQVAESARTQFCAMRRGIRCTRPEGSNDHRVTMRQEATRALYEGSLAQPGDRNPYAGRSLVLAKLWMRGYQRMLSVRINSGPAMQRYVAARAAAQQSSS